MICVKKFPSEYSDLSFLGQHLSLQLSLSQFFFNLPVSYQALYKLILSFLKPLRSELFPFLEANTFPAPSYSLYT